jgi:signal transduction histidine kinase
MAALGQLVAGIAHELNTPVGAIASAQDSLRKAAAKLDGKVTTEDAGTRRLLEMIDRSTKIVESGSERVTGIVQRLKSFARLDQADFQNVDIHRCVDDALNFTRGQLSAGIELSTRYGDLPHVQCFPSQINQLVLNLLLNAARAVGDGGTIVIATELSGEEDVCIIVEDDGIGIPAGDLDRVFDPGFTTKGVGVGTGLGLAVSYQIAKNHHGDIAIISPECKGCRVTVTLPRVQPTEVRS